MSGELVSRFDVASLGKPERTSQGFMRIPAFLTRAGVLEYKRADGSVVRELRPPEEVFHARSLATLSAAPVTDMHPTEMITPANVRSLSIGHVSDDVRPDGEMVSAAVTVQDGEVISAVERGDRRELSCGYKCRIDATPGVYKGQRYDQIQRDIVYNHVALGPRNWGRAGRDIALRLDAEPTEDDRLVFRLDEGDALCIASAEPEDEEVDADEAEDDAGQGDEPEADAEQLERERDVLNIALDEAVAELAAREDAPAVIAERDKLRARCDLLERECATLQAALTEAKQAHGPRAFDAAVHRRADLMMKARRVLSEDFRFDGLSERQVHEAVLHKLDPSTNYASESDDYLRARFDSAIAGGARNSALDHARRVLAQPRAATHMALRSDAKPFVPPWRRPLAISKNRTRGEEP